MHHYLNTIEETPTDGGLYGTRALKCSVCACAQQQHGIDFFSRVKPDRLPTAYHATIDNDVRPNACRTIPAHIKDNWHALILGIPQAEGNIPHCSLCLRLNHLQVTPNP